MHQMMVVVAEVIQVIHRLVTGRGCRVIPVVGVVLRMVQQVVVVMMSDEHGSRGRLRRR